ncbi:MAG: hypothetical protein AAB955_01040 [Patescibacteria group bacterium]
MKELERTFLARALPDLDGATSREMLDIYLPTSSDHPILRIRKQGDRHEMTKKAPIDDADRSVQLEQTIPLSVNEYAELSTLPGKRVAKTRYYYTEGVHTYEIDVFREALSGLVLIDIEFDTVADKDAFVAPALCLAEVTQEQFLAGGMLCGKSYADIEARLAPFGYQKIVTH